MRIIQEVPRLRTKKKSLNSEDFVANDLGSVLKVMWDLDGTVK